MLLEAMRLFLAALLLVALPGFLLVNATFPRSRSQVGTIERVYLALAGGVLLLMLVGILLGSLPHGDTGWFSTIATGTPNLELATLAMSVLLFYVGLARGAYPRVAARFPRLVRPEGRAGRPLG